MIRVLLTSLVFLAAIGSGCTLTPVYGPASQQSVSELAFRYAAPASRLDQIVYQELSLRFGRSEAITAPQLTVTTRARARDLGRTTRRPFDQSEVTVTATATVVQAGAPPFSVSRQASAIYMDGGQVLANEVAREEARERAAKAAAESLRLALLARFAGGLQP